MGEGDLAKSSSNNFYSHNFYSGYKSLIHSSSYSIFGVCGEKGLVENVMCGKGVGRKRQNIVRGEGI